MARKKAEFAERIKGLRESFSMNQAQFAEALGVTHPLVSQCESGKKEKPSTDFLVRLGGVAAERKRFNDAKWFWEKAGIDMNALDKLADIRVQEKTASSSAFILIDGIDERGSEAVSFASALLRNPASTRFVRLEGEQFPFKQGDIVLVDSTETDLRAIEEEALIAVFHGDRHYVGELEKTSYVGPAGGSASGKNQTWFVLKKAAHDRNLIIATAKGDGVVETEYSILGRVVGWVHQGEHGRRRSDSYHIHAAGHVPKSKEEIARLRKLAEKDQQFPEQKEKKKK